MVRRQQMRACEQAGQWISLRLDGELSELEEAGLHRHLDRCAGCSALATELTGIAHLLRSAPLAEFDRELALAEPSRRRVRVPVRAAVFAAVGSAVAAVLAFLLIGTFGSAHSSRNALEFRSTGEEVRFVHVEQSRIEPPRRPVKVVTAPPMNPRGLL
jgi:anti-sigma factor RsiW